MKRILSTCLFGFMVVAGWALAANVQLNWDAKPAADTRTNVRIYERFGSGPPYTYTFVTSVSEPVATVTLTGITSGVHVFVARGWNGQSEGPDSNAVSTVVLAVPGGVTSVTLTFVP